MNSINNRQFTRFTSAEGKWVKVMWPFKDEFKMYVLLDISQGGVAIKSNNAIEFKRGDEILITQIEEHIFNQPIYCKVIYVRPIDEFGIDFKVGIEFIEKI